MSEKTYNPEIRRYIIVAIFLAVALLGLSAEKVNSQDLSVESLHNAGSVIIGDRDTGYGQGFVVDTGQELEIWTVSHVMDERGDEDRTPIFIPGVGHGRVSESNPVRCENDNVLDDPLCGVNFNISYGRGLSLNSIYQRNIEAVLDGRELENPIPFTAFTLSREHDDFYEGALVAVPRPDTGAFTILVVTDIRSDYIVLSSAFIDDNMPLGVTCAGRSGAPIMVTSGFEGDISVQNGRSHLNFENKEEILRMARTNPSRAYRMLSQELEIQYSNVAVGGVYGTPGGDPIEDYVDGQGDCDTTILAVRPD